jgi:hypothetical protein
MRMSPEIFEGETNTITAVMEKRSVHSKFVSLSGGYWNEIKAGIYQGWCKYIFVAVHKPSVDLTT